MRRAPLRRLGWALLGEVVWPLLILLGVLPLLVIQAVLDWLRGRRRA